MASPKRWESYRGQGDAALGIGWHVPWCGSDFDSRGGLAFGGGAGFAWGVFLPAVFELNSPEDER